MFIMTLSRSLDTLPPPFHLGDSVYMNPTDQMELRKQTLETTALLGLRETPDALGKNLGGISLTGSVPLTLSRQLGTGRFYDRMSFESEQRDNDDDPLISIWLHGSQRLSQMQLLSEPGSNTPAHLKRFLVWPRDLPSPRSTVSFVDVCMLMDDLLEMKKSKLPTDAKEPFSKLADPREPLRFDYVAQTMFTKLTSRAKTSGQSHAYFGYDDVTAGVGDEFDGPALPIRSKLEITRTRVNQTIDVRLVTDIDIDEGRVEECFTYTLPLDANNKKDKRQDRTHVPTAKIHLSSLVVPIKRLEAFMPEVRHNAGGRTMADTAIRLLEKTNTARVFS